MQEYLLISFIIVHADLLLSDVIDKVKKHRTRLAEHEGHVDTELAEKTSTKVLLHQINNGFDLFHWQGCNSDIVQVDKHDPVLDPSWDQ